VSFKARAESGSVAKMACGVDHAEDSGVGADPECDGSRNVCIDWIASTAGQRCGKPREVCGSL
jgi:hypothetical protein